MKNGFSYFDTTDTRGPLLDQYEEAAKNQEQSILVLFKTHKRLSPSEAFKLYAMLNVPITSIRRAITNLEKNNRLRKLKYQVDGMYGRKEYVWEYIEHSKQLTLFI